MKHFLYKVSGLSFLVLATPSLAVFLGGTLSGHVLSNAFLILAIGGIPLGIFLFMFGMGRYPINRISNAALVFAWAALGANIPLIAAFAFVKFGFPIFGGAIVFSELFITFTSLFAFVLLLAARAKGHTHHTF